MTVLLVDIGNTRIKWARLEGGRIGRLHAAVHDGWGVEDYARRVIGAARLAGSANASGATRFVGPSRATRLSGSARVSASANAGVAAKRGWFAAAAKSVTVPNRTRAGLERIVVASVAGSAADKRLIAAAKRVGAPAPDFVASTRHAAGVTIGYIEPWRLGVDRFVAVIGAHHLSKGRPVCVVGVGTALTIDLVGADGRHWGGAIIPAPQLMVDSLLQHTSGIRRRAQGGARGGTGLFARSTRGAIGQGALYAAAATIDRAMEEARAKVGEAPLVFLNGGGARAVQPLMRCASVSVPDLVLRGLAVLSGAGAPRTERTHGGRARSGGVRGGVTHRSKASDGNHRRGEPRRAPRAG